MTRAQCRAARGLLDWTQAKLAEAAGLPLAKWSNWSEAGEPCRRELFKPCGLRSKPPELNSFQRTVAARA